MKRVHDYLSGAGSHDERRDRELLLAHVLGCDRAHLYTHPDEPVAACVEALFERRSQDEPVAYLTGRRGFWSFDLEVNPNVLIPRPETELLVELALTRIGARGRVLDLGTGSGAIALAIAHERPGANVTGCDNSFPALLVARSNGQRLDTQVEWLESDWFEEVRGEFDVIVSNPPYIAEADPHLPALRYEPRSALVAGDDGLAALRQVVAGAPVHLVEGGWLIVEHGYDQAVAVRELFRCADLREIETHRDLAGHERATVGSKALCPKAAGSKAAGSNPGGSEVSRR